MVNAEQPDDQAGPPSADFAALHAQAAAIEGAAVPSAPGAPAEAEPDNAAELLGALEMARLMVKPMLAWWVDFDRVWSDGTLRGIAQGGAAVMDKHGWTMGGVWGEFGPYLALIGSTAPPAFATWQAIRAHRDELERQARAEAKP